MQMALLITTVKMPEEFPGQSFFSGSDNYILLKHEEQLKNPRHHSARILPVTNMM